MSQSVNIDIKIDETLPDAWILSRLKHPGEDELLAEIDSIVRVLLKNCPRCSSIYDQTGWIVQTCDVCQASRSLQWTADIEALARSKIAIKLIRSRLRK